MLAISELNLEKDSMNIRSSKLVILVLLAFMYCSPDLSDDAIPYVNFSDIVMNLSLPEYSNLQTKGYQYINNGGVKGIIIYKASASIYYAYERNCSYSPNEACATVEVDASGLYMKDPCCGSLFNMAGEPTGGPAWRPLRKYQTALNGNVLTITDEIAN